MSVEIAGRVEVIRTADSDVLMDRAALMFHAYFLPSTEQTLRFIYTYPLCVLMKEQPPAPWWSWCTSHTVSLRGRMDVSRQGTWSFLSCSRMFGEKHNRSALQPPEFAWEQFSHIRYLAFTSFSSQTLSNDKYRGYCCRHVCTALFIVWICTWGFICKRKVGP